MKQHPPTYPPRHPQPPTPRHTCTATLTCGSSVGVHGQEFEVVCGSTQIAAPSLGRRPLRVSGRETGRQGDSLKFTPYTPSQVCIGRRVPCRRR
ncbi:hypothetical protein E2C01_092352 [Portunus trituberculatus]|uniref:Uncharacterized protein n=1 Tax=Portunus trituberculatus TaxID=210409 RepID=A0A5B7JRH9_PORTR|nr:hypothetical protein [Portunus trituberculatus]